MLSRAAAMLLGILFYRSPALSFSQDEIEQYEAIYSEAIIHNKEIVYTSRYPKQRFIQYIAANKPVLLHGSNNKQILSFEPRRQTLFNGQYVDAVFATSDGIWPVYYAIFDRSKLVNSMRNACLTARTGRSFYFFSLTRETLAAEPWTSGLIYFLPRESFTRAPDSTVSFDEWTSTTAVNPLTKIAVEPEDFYYKDKIACHKPAESIAASWLLYKFRKKSITRIR